MPSPSRSSSGFTLIELLIGLGIIGVIATIVLVAINPSKQLCDTQNAARLSNARHIQDAVYQHLVGQWTMPNDADIPLGEANAKPVCRLGVSGDATCVSFDALVPTYIAAIPVDDAEENANYSGFSVYKQAGRAFLVADHRGSCTTVEAPQDGGATGGTTGGDAGGTDGGATGGTGGEEGGGGPFTGTLVGWWPFTELSGTTVGDGAGSNPLSVSLGSRWTCGSHDGAYRFASGLSAQADGDATLDFSGSFTVAALVRVHASQQQNVVFSQRNENCGMQHIQLYTSDSYVCGGNAAVSFGDNSGEHISCCSSGALPTGEWIHLVGTYDGEEMRLYIDGVLDAACAVPGTLLTTTDTIVHIGADECGNGFDGDIDDVRLYSTAADAADAAGLLAEVATAGSCTEPTEQCGNGAVEGGEECDDGNGVSCDGCATDCTQDQFFACSGSPSACAPQCGDGWRVAEEECDDGNAEDGDGCTACVIDSGYVWETSGSQGSACFTAESGTAHTSCGDGEVGGSEECDVGGGSSPGCVDCVVTAGYACSGTPSSCAPVCGDSILVAGVEACDDGNEIDCDGCSATCTQATEGYTCSGSEPGACVPTCGDGYVLPSEQCDDGNQSPSDGCDGDCGIEIGWTWQVTGGPADACQQLYTGQAVSVCGDGITVSGEQCDDGNTESGDGCSDTCEVE